jgi:hypothetical protein
MAPARPASAAPPASNGVFARFATPPTLRAADPTVLAPFAAVSLTVPPTPPIVLRPFRERVAERPFDAVERPFDAVERPFDAVERPLEVAERPFRERVAERPFDVVDEDRLPDEVDRAPDEPLAFELEVLRALEALVRLLLPPFLDVLLERLVPRRRLVRAFACAITPPFRSSIVFGIPFQVSLAVTRRRQTETACF